MLPLPRLLHGFRRRLAATTLLLLAAAACTDRPTEPAVAAHVRAGLEDKAGNPLLVVGSSVRGIARLEAVLESDALGEPARFEFKNEQPESDEAWGGIPVPRGAKSLLTLRGYDVEGRARFVGRVAMVANGEVVRQVRAPVTLLEAKEGEGAGEKTGEKMGAEWTTADVVYAGSYRVAFTSRGFDEKSGALLVAAWVHDADGTRRPIAPEDIKTWLEAELGRIEVMHDERELREIVLAMYPPEEVEYPRPRPGSLKVCVYEELTCGAVVINPELPPPPPPVRYVEVVAKESHGCALRTSGLARCWGTDVAGELAGGSANSLLAPYQFKDIDTHGRHSCGVTTAGDVLCWGWNGSMELGRTSPANQLGHNAPAPIEPYNDYKGAIFQAVTTGASHSCGLTTNGTVWCWGSNTYGQLGDGNGHRLLFAGPTRVDFPDAFIQIDAGDDHTCGVTISQAVFCWGRDDAHQTGDAPEVDASPASCYGWHNVYVACRKVPGRVGTSRFLRVSADGMTTCAIRDDHQAFCWGRSLPGAAGGTGTTSATPLLFGRGTVHSALTVGEGHACLVDPVGTPTPIGPPTCSGANDHMQLGSGSPSAWGTASPSLGMRPMGIGKGFSCGISGDRATLWCWGRSGTHLGFPNASDVARPTVVTVF